jgi:hypothetical protein
LPDINIFMKRYTGMRHFKFRHSIFLTIICSVLLTPVMGQGQLYHEGYRTKKQNEGGSKENQSPNQEEDVEKLRASLDSVISELIILKDENRRLKQENETLLSYTKESTKKAVEERKNQSLASERGAGFGAVKTSDYGGYQACIECTSYQPLFSEKISFHYTLSPNNKSFKGIFRFSYAPEFGQRESREQLVSGKYTETKDDLSFFIDFIDQVRTDIRLVVNDRSYKSSFKAGPNASILPYTKVTYFEDMTVYKCLF